MKGGEKKLLGNRITGTITMPPDAKIIYVGASPPRGELVAYAEISDIDEPLKETEVVVLANEDPIPTGYEFFGHILSVPILFVYKKTSAIRLS